MSFFDFCIPLFIKFMVILTTNMIPISFLAAIFAFLEFVHVPFGAAYFGEMAFFVVSLFLIYTAFKFNSKFMLRKIARNKDQNNPLFYYPHPLIKNIATMDSSKIRMRKRIAIALIELKSYTFATGLYFIIIYFLFLAFMHHMLPNSIKCAGDCQIYRYGVKSLGGGIVFDFFDTFEIPVTDIKNSDVSLPIKIMSFC
jgi:hypothetical protein